MKSILGNWKTSLGGLGMLLTGLGGIATGISEGTGVGALDVGLVTGGFGMLFSRDGGTGSDA